MTLKLEECSYLELQTHSRTIWAQTVCKARILLLEADGEPINIIAEKDGLNRYSVMLCLKKFKKAVLKTSCKMLSDAVAMRRVRTLEKPVLSILSESGRYWIPQ